MHLKVGVLVPNWWQELHCVVPVSEACAFASGPGEICAKTAGAQTKQAMSARNPMVALIVLPEPFSWLLPGVPLCTRLSEFASEKFSFRCWVAQP
jgi:hypothetical protein